MRALVWASFVTMPDCDPVKLTAATPRAFRAIDSRAMEIRSPAVSSMSSSRRAGLSQTCRASFSSSSVVSPMAETTTTTSLPEARVAATRSATFWMRPTSATDEPPYFWTTIGIGRGRRTRSARRRRLRRLSLDGHPEEQQHRRQGYHEGEHEEVQVADRQHDLAAEAADDTRRDRHDGRPDRVVGGLELGLAGPEQI